MFSSVECINSECENYSDKLFIEVAERESKKFEITDKDVDELFKGIFNFGFGD